MVDARIAMGNVALDTATPVTNAGNQQTQNALATERLLQEQFKTFDAREQSRLTNTIVGASQLKTFLDKDDVEGAHEFLMKRKSQLQNRMAGGENIDTQETDYAIDQLRRGNIDGLKNEVAALMSAGQVYGIIGGMQGAPSNVQEWQYYNNLSPEDQQRYLTMKRSNQTVNLGGSQMVVGPTGAPVANYQVTPKPDEMPDFKRDQAKATAEGTAAGEAGATAQNTINKMGGLVASLEDLKGSAASAPSGAISTGMSQAANLAGVGTQDNVALGDFTVKRAAAENEIRQAFRVVGSGATSDRDALPFIQMLPTENDSTAVKVAKTTAALNAVKGKVRELARQRNLPDPFADDVPPGAKLVGTSGGKNVYQLPDGSHVMED